MSTKRMRVLVLVCSTRPGAVGPAVGEWFIETVRQRAGELDVELVPTSLAELQLPFLDEEEEPASGIYAHEHTRRWSALVDGADGFVVVTPEYNYGMPASLKNALDYLGREWAWKPIGFISYGNTSAGTRSVQHAKQVVSTLRLVPLGSTVAIRLGDAVKGGDIRPSATQAAAAASVLDELVRVGHALRPLRERARPDLPSGPLPGSYTRPLTPDDAAEVVVLQRCCWVEEALANDTLAIPALHESSEQVRAWLASWQTTGLWRDGRLLGMVRARRVGTEWHVGRLAVVPDLRGHGLGRWLLRTAEGAVEPGCRRVVLHTGARSEQNIGLYQSEGFQLVPLDGDGDDIACLAKVVAAPRDGLSAAPSEPRRSASPSVGAR